MDCAEKMQRCHEYVEALEEEKRKIQVFQRELPLCLELVTQAIEACRRELAGATTTTTGYMHGQPEYSEQTSTDVPVLEEFIPIKRSSCSNEDGDEQHSHKNTSNKEKINGDKRKLDWLRSVQLWNQSPDPLPKELWNQSPDPLTKEDVPRKTTVVEVKRNGGAFQPFHREKIVGKTKQSACKVTCSEPAVATSSTTENGSKGGGSGGYGYSKKKHKEGQTQRKQRRCWSPELHRRFLHSLQQLGGSHAATPKQIRELMKVDGLTNDEVKSHLQKYRLHTRRPNQSIHNTANPQAPQFVVVGGLWLPPPEYATVAPKSSGEASIMTTANGVYAVGAVSPPAIPQSSASPIRRPQRAQSNQLQVEERGSHSEGGGHHSNSPSTSSSTHTTTASPAFQ